MFGGPRPQTKTRDVLVQTCEYTRDLVADSRIVIRNVTCALGANTTGIFKLRWATTHLIPSLKRACGQKQSLMFGRWDKSQVSNNSRENCPNLTFQENPKTIISLLILKVPLAFIGLSTKKGDKIRYIPRYIIVTFC